MTGRILDLLSFGPTVNYTSRTVDYFDFPDKPAVIILSISIITRAWTLRDCTWLSWFFYARTEIAVNGLQPERPYTSSNVTCPFCKMRLHGTLAGPRFKCTNLIIHNPSMCGCTTLFSLSISFDLHDAVQSPKCAHDKREIRRSGGPGMQTVIWFPNTLFRIWPSGWRLSGMGHCYWVVSRFSNDICKLHIIFTTMHSFLNQFCSFGLVLALFIRDIS